jgi:hypothetical protein
MMIRFNVIDDHQIIVPLRFARAGTGSAWRDRPEIDDRGYLMGTRPSGWGETDTRGAMVGLTVNFRTKIKVVREDIDDETPLFVTTENPDVVEVLDPDNGGPIPEDGIFRVRGKTARGSPGRIYIRLGAIDGPILAELEPHVFAKRTLKLTFHQVRIDDSTHTGTRATLPIDRLARRVRAIWWPCGLDMEYDPRRRPVVSDNITFARQNEVNDPANDHWAEVKRTLNLGGWDDNVHAFIIDKFTPDASGLTTVGMGIRPDLATRLHCAPGILLTADGVVGNDAEIERTARTLAHEIGHFLTLEHVQRKNASTPPARDTYSRRQLMYPLSTVETQVTPRTLMGDRRFNNNGYGNRVRGWLITMKNHAHHSTDGECGSARTAARRVQTRGGWR